MLESKKHFYRPFLATLAVQRSGASPLPGRYCPNQQVWVVDTPGGSTPMISFGPKVAGDGPMTKVDRERDQIGLFAALQLTTKTDQQIERDDTSPYTISALHELTTKTEAIPERDDQVKIDHDILCELSTKTATSRERDDQ